MNQDESWRQERKRALARWVDKHSVALEHGLTVGWPDLRQRLQQGIEHLSWSELATGPGEEFRKRWIERPVTDWVGTHVQPLLEEARKDLHSILPPAAGPLLARTSVPANAHGTLSATDVARVLTLPAGLLLGGGALATSIGTATSWLIFTTTVIHWPLLIGGLLVGTFLSLFGVWSLAGLKAELQARFTRRLLPQIEDAVIGKGTQQGGTHIPSLRDQLLCQLEATAEAARNHLEEQGAAR
jgi:hypothetical protein